MPAQQALRTATRSAQRGPRRAAATVGPARSVVSALGNRAVGRSWGPARLRPGPGPTAGALGHQPDPYVRALLQGAVGRDLGDVRVRTGQAQRAVLDASGVDALTLGGVIALRREDDRPGTVAGRGLLLHELVHVLQQTDGPRDPAAGPRDDAAAEVLETDARDVARELVAGPAFPVGPGRVDDADRVEGRRGAEAPATGPAPGG